MFRPTLKWLYYPCVLIILVLTVFTTQIKTDLSAFFITGDNAEEIILANEMQQGRLSRRYILSLGSKRAIPTERDWLSELLQQFNAIQGVTEVWRPDDQRFKIEMLKSLPDIVTPCLSSYDLETVLDEVLTETGLQQRAEILKSALMSPHARFIKKIAVQDPLLLSLTGFKRLTGLIGKPVPAQTGYKNLMLETEATGFDYEQQQQIQTELQSVVTSYNKSYSLPIELQMTGVPVFAVATQSLIEGDVKKVSILSSIFLTILFLLLFRSANALLQVTLLLIAVICSSILVTQSVFGYVHAMTLAIGSTLIGICIDYPIHALVHARHVKIHERTQVIAAIWPSMILGGITTLIGYLALGFSGYPGFQQIAVYAGCGIPMALLITRYVLPYVSIDAETKPVHLKWAVFWLNHCQQFRWLWGLMLTLAVCAAVFAVQNLTWLQDMEQLTPELQQLKHQDKEIRSRLLSRVEPGRFIMVTGENLEAALLKSEHVYKVLDHLKTEGIIDEYFGLYPWLLSKRQQHRNADLIAERISSRSENLWQIALQEQGLSAEFLALPEDYARCRMVSFEDLKASPVFRLIQNQILFSKDKSVVLIWIGDHHPHALAQALQVLPDVKYFSQKDLLNTIANDYRTKADYMLKIGLGIIFLLLLLRYRNLLSVWQTLLPALLAALFILAGWSAANQALSFLHLVGFLLAVAICVDYGIFFKENRGKDIAVTYQAMAASMLTSALVFSCLALAQTASLRTLGIVVASGVILGFLLCPLVIKQTD